MRTGEAVKRHATRAGLSAALAALLLWPAYSIVQGWWLRWPFVATLLIAAASGAAILILVLLDLIAVRRSRQILPARLFDLALGTLLLVPAALALKDLLPT